MLGGVQHLLSLADPSLTVLSLFPFFLPQKLCTRGHLERVRVLTLTWRVTLGGHFIILDLSDLLLGELFCLEAGSTPPHSSPLHSSIPASSPADYRYTGLLLNLTSALCLCFSSCWADFCLAFSTLLTGSLTLDFSLREG